MGGAELAAAHRRRFRTDDFYDTMACMGSPWSRQTAMLVSAALALGCSTAVSASDGTSATARSSLSTSAASNTDASPDFPHCDDRAFYHLAMLRNVPAHKSPWTMAAQVMVANHYGPDCSYRGTPTIVLAKDEPNSELPTQSTRVEDFPEQPVKLRWTRTPDGREYKGRVGYFIVYTTNRDTDGTECPGARMVVGEKPKTSFPPFRGGRFVGWPVHEGPVLSTCDGRIGVTPLAQAPDEVTREE